MRDQMQQASASGRQASMPGLVRRMCGALLAAAWLTGLPSTSVLGIPSVAHAAPAPQASAWQAATAGGVVPFAAHAARVPQPREGERLFQQFCAACHTIGGGRLMGPDLRNITDRRGHEWLVRFITDPDQMRRAGDPVAIASLEEFGIPMPRLGLTRPQVQAVVAFMKGAQAVQVVPALFVPTLVSGVLVIVGLTVIGLAAGRKSVEVRP